MDPYRFIPSERTAMTIEEFVEGCRAEPALAADQLHRGYFEPGLRDAGRPDPAEAAAQVRSEGPEHLRGWRYLACVRLALLVMLLTRSRSCRRSPVWRLR